MMHLWIIVNVFMIRDESILTCKLGLKDAISSLDLDKYPLDKITVLILFVQEFPEKKVKSRVLDLCFINRFGKSLQELAICGYQTTYNKIIQIVVIYIYLIYLL